MTKVQSVFQTGQARVDEFSFPYPEGTPRFYQAQLVPELTQEGDIDSVLVVSCDITALKQTEAALQASEQRYRHLAEAMPQMVWTADATGAVTYFNQRWYDYSGRTEADSIGLEGANAVHPDERDRTLQHWSQAVATGEQFEIEYRIRRHDGVYHWFISRGLPIRDSDNQITGWVGTITDIDDQKRVEEALRQSEARISPLVKSNILGILEAQQEQVVFANDAFLQMVGYTQEDVQAGRLRWQEMTPPEYREIDRAKVHEVLTSGVCTPFEKEYIRKDGSRVPILLGAALLTREPLQWGCFILDLTERKQAQAALQSANMGSWDWNIVTGDVHWSTNLEQLFGLTPGTFSGRYEAVVAMIHPDDRDWVLQAVHRALYENEDYNIEPDAREFLKTALEQYGATVATASSVQDALQQLAIVQPDVLLSDIGMPGEDGYSLIRQIRTLPAEQGGQIPAIALTVYAREEDRLQALASGFQMHVPKPIEPLQLLTVIN